MSSTSTGLAAPTEGSGEPSDIVGMNGGSLNHSRSRSPGLSVVNPAELEPRASSPARPPTSAEIDAVIAAAMANAPPVPNSDDGTYRSNTPLMTNMLPASVGSDGRVNLFVGNLPYRVRWQDLKDLFRKAGTVLRADVSLGQDNRSRGYGTVLMGSREDAARAIDRFNGYTWQTRTLEVRPDRLPPEYEPAQPPPQMQQPNRVPMFPYVGTNHFGPGHPGGHPGGGGPGWHPQNHHRPPMPFGPPHHMPNHMIHPGMSLSPHPPHMSMGGPGLGPGRSHSPAHFGPNGMHQPPLSGQNTGSHMYGPPGASPLAGSLSTGGDGLPRPGSSMSNPLGFSPHSSNLALPRASSPAMQPVSNSRPNSSAGHRSVSPGDGMRQHSTGQPKGSTVPGPQLAAGPGQSHDGHGQPPPHGIDHGHVPHLEGLGHKKAVLGPPGNLHDRVVFVSGLPMSMQWQELKDLLRPAGLIIRADVLVDAEGRSRGYGTALFGSEKDAARAVRKINGRVVDGRPIRVYLERDSHHHDARRPSQSQTDESGPGPESLQGQNSEPSEMNATAATTPDTTPSQPKHQLASRVPWHLNLGGQATPTRGAPNLVDSTPHFRSGFPTTPNGIATPHSRSLHHPGPISMPPWPSSMDGSNPLSPTQSRGLPPMTPSMPGFVFNNVYPDTPPVPHHFMSMGPFSPGLPVTSPTGFAYNPFLNAAPGAPIYRPQTGGSAQLGTPTTQVFPHNAIRGAGPPGAPVIPEEYFPSADPQSQSQSPSQSMTPPSLGQRTASQSVLNARSRLAPTGPDPIGDQTSVNSLAASMALHNLTTNGATETSTPPSPTSGKRQVKRVYSGVDLSKLVEETERTTNASSGTSTDDGLSVRPGRLSMDEQRPKLDLEVPIGGERRASFGDSR